MPTFTPTHPLRYCGNGHAILELSSTGSSSASYADICSCQYKAFFSVILSRRSTEESSGALNFGAMFHLTQELRAWTLIGQPQRYLDSYDLTDQGDYMDNVRAMINKVSEDYPLSHRDWRNLDILFYIAEQYHSHYRDPSFSPAYYQPQGEGTALVPAVEMPFAFQMNLEGDTPSISWPGGKMLQFITPDGIETHLVTTVDVIFRGKIDLIHFAFGKLYIRDYKTASRDTWRYFDLKEFSDQFCGYYWMASKIAPMLKDRDGNPVAKDITGVECDRVKFGKPSMDPRIKELNKLEKKLNNLLANLAKPSYVRHKWAEEEKPKTEAAIHLLREELSQGKDEKPVVEFQRKLLDKYTPDRVTDWVRNTLCNIENFLLSHSNNYFPQNRTACEGTYGICPYFDVCREPKKAHPVMIMSGMFEDKKPKE